MMKVLFFFALTYFPTWVSGQINALGRGFPWPKIYEATVESSVTLENGDFNYAYTVCNSAKNRVSLYAFQIDMRVDPMQHQLSRQDLIPTHTGFEHLAILSNSEKVKIRNAVSPSNWTSEYPGLWGMQYELRTSYMVQPAKCMSGFFITSTVPVSIREFVVEGYDLDFFQEPESYNFKGTGAEFTLEFNKGIQYLGRTIAPVNPPIPFIISSWTVRMETDAADARTLGWIKNDRNLDEIKKMIAGLRNETMANLKPTVGKIEKYCLSEKKKGNLTDEADALIRLNAQYLLSRHEKSGASK